MKPTRQIIDNVVEFIFLYKKTLKQCNEVNSLIENVITLGSFCHTFTPINGSLLDKVVDILTITLNLSEINKDFIYDLMFDQTSYGYIGSKKYNFEDQQELKQYFYDLLEI